LEAPQFKRHTGTSAVAAGSTTNAKVSSELYKNHQ